MTKHLVKVNHNGSCEGYHYTKGVALPLPESVLRALGEDSYEMVEENYHEKPDYETLLARAKELRLVNLDGKTVEELQGIIAEREAELAKKAAKPQTPYQILQARAKELGLNGVGKKMEELEQMVAEKEAELANENEGGNE